VIRFCAILLIGLMTLWPRTLLAQSPDDAVNPVRIGDQWTYDTKDEITGATTRTFTATITEITPKEIVTRLTFRGSTGTALVAFDREWNRTANGDFRFKPNDAQGVRFPLAVGKEWRSEFVNSNVKTGVNMKGSSSSKIVAQETVTTPAGSFETFKVERQLKEFNAADPSRSADAQIVMWYAPQINHWVRRTIVTKVDKRMSSNETDELVAYNRTTREPASATAPTKTPNPAAPAETQQDERKVALKSGESVVLRQFIFVSNCISMLTAPTTIDVLQGADEVSLSVREQMVVPLTRNCPNPVPGGVVVATAKTIDQPKEVKITYRLNYTTKTGPRQSSNSYIISLFPGDAVSVPTPSENSASPSPPASPQ
jgi:hypothetical protein